MIKLVNLLKEIEQERREQQLEEGWKENIIAAAMAASMLVGGVKGQSSDGGIGGKAGIEMKTQQGPGPLDVNFGTAFPSGRYIIKGEAQGTLESKLGEIAKYIEQNPNADYTIEIISSESQVPNYDAEKPGRVKLDTGELAEKRATVLNVAIKALTQKLKEDGKLKGNVNIKIAPVLIGSEKFKSGIDNKDDAKYTKDQFVNIKVTATTKDIPPPTTRFSSQGEPMHMGNETVALAFYSIDGDPGYKDILLKIVKRNTALSGKIDQSGVFTQSYLIKAADWNKIMGRAHEITSDKLQQLIKVSQPNEAGYPKQ